MSRLRALLQEALEISNEPNFDKQDVAFLALGASRAYLHAGNTRGYGFSEVIEFVIEYAGLLTQVYDQLGEDASNVMWYYDVAEPVGEFIAAKHIAGEDISEAEFREFVITAVEKNS